MSIIDQLDNVRAATNVLEHPFYRRWSAGELSAGELTCYAAQYRHAVVALAEASARAAAKAPAQLRDALGDHAEEERAHVGLWDRFARQAGAGDAQGEPALPETDACVRAWTAGEDMLEHLAVLYAIEAGQPEVSRTKLDGLGEHYGYVAEGPASEYFRVHELRDVEHAREAAELIERLLAEEPEREQELVRCAAEALRGNWLLLDGVERAAAA
jgi:pyrroloquinoline quinone (PQQ) biosynthesis protein C